MTILGQLLSSRQLAAAVTESCLANEAALAGLGSLLDNSGEGSLVLKRGVTLLGSGHSARQAALRSVCWASSCGQQPDVPVALCQLMLWRRPIQALNSQLFSCP